MPSGSTSRSSLELVSSSPAGTSSSRQVRLAILGPVRGRGHRSKCPQLPVCLACKLLCHYSQDERSSPGVFRKSFVGNFSSRRAREVPVNRELLCECEKCCGKYRDEIESEQNDLKTVEVVSEIEEKEVNQNSVSPVKFQSRVSIKVEPFDEQASDAYKIQLPRGYSSVSKFLNEFDSFVKYQEKSRSKRKRNSLDAELVNNDQCAKEELFESLDISEFFQKKPKLSFTLFNEEDQVPFVPTLSSAGFERESKLNFNLSREDPNLFVAKSFLIKRPISDLQLFEGKREVRYFESEEESDGESRSFKASSKSGKLQTARTKHFQAKVRSSFLQKAKHHRKMTGAPKRKRTNVDENSPPVSKMKLELNPFETEDSNIITQKSKRVKTKLENDIILTELNDKTKEQKLINGAKTSAKSKSHKKAQGNISKNNKENSKSGNKNGNRQPNSNKAAMSRSHKRKTNNNYSLSKNRVVKDFRIEADDKVKLSTSQKHVSNCTIRRKKHWIEPQRKIFKPLKDPEVCKKFKIIPYCIPTRNIALKIDQRKKPAKSVYQEFEFPIYTTKPRVKPKSIFGGFGRRDGLRIRLIQNDSSQDPLLAQLGLTTGCGLNLLNKMWLKENRPEMGIELG